MNSGIYEIVNLVNGKRYVGSAVNIDMRWRQHRCELGKGRHNPHMQSAWEKHGESAFEFRVIERIADKTKLLEREQHFIDTLKPEYNCARIAGSNLGIKFGDEVRAKIGKASRDVWSTPGYRERMSAVHKGHVHSPEHRAKISAANTGRKLSSEHAEKLARLNAERNKSEKHRAMVSEFWKGRPKPAEQLARMAATKRGCTLSDEHKQKLSEAGRKAYAEGRRSKDKPEDVRISIGKGVAKYPDDLIAEIRRKKAGGARNCDLCAEYGIGQAAMSNICTGKTYRWVTVG